MRSSDSDYTRFWRQRELSRGLGDLLVDRQRLAILIERLVGQHRLVANELVLHSLNQEVDFGLPRSERLCGHIDMNRRAMSKSNPLVRPIFKTSHSDPRRSIDRDSLLKLVLERVAIGSSVLRFQSANDFTVNDDFDPVQRHVTGRRTMNKVFTWPRVSCSKRMAGWLPIHLDQQHRPGCDKTSSCIQTAEPRLIAERLGTSNIDATKSQRHWMNPGCRASRWPQSKAAVQQGVVILKSRVDPAPLSQTLGVALSPHVFRSRLTPAAKSKLRPPDMIVRQLIEVWPHDGHQHHRPRPIVLVELNQSALAMNPLGDAAHRRCTDVKHRLMVQRKKRAQRVRLLVNREQLIFRIPRGIDVCRV